MMSVLGWGPFLLAILAGVIVVGLPGLALARLFQWPSPRPSPSLTQGFLLGFAILPVIDALMARLIALDAALILNLVLAAVALVLWLRAGRPLWRPDFIVLALLGAWLLLVAFDMLDLRIGDGLYPPLTTFDMIKHAALTQAIADKGVPPPDPFFLRPERASYYYFFYVLPALAERLCGGFIDARAAVTGLIFWTGVALYGLFRFVVVRAGAVPAPRWLVLLVLATGGLDAIMALDFGIVGGRWLAQPDDWNEQITGWFQSVLWVPHHLCGLMAAMIGMASLTAPGPTRRRRIALCALCWAATFGLSVWVFLGLAATLVVWLARQLARRQWAEVTVLAGSGAFALVLVLPQLVDLIHGRAPGGYAQIAFSVRWFTPVEGLVPAGVWQQLLRAVTLPVNYFAVFGALMSGTLLYWRARSRARPFDNEFDRILALSGLVGLFIGSFFKSTTINNDLGWRIMLFPLMTGSVWTFRALSRRRETSDSTSIFPGWPRVMVGLIAVGMLTNVYAVFSLRLAPWFPNASHGVPVREAARVENDLRDAYLWTRHNLNGAVLQHNPLHHAEPGLYGVYRVGVEDFYAPIFGADARATDVRLGLFAQVFCRNLSDAALADLSRRIGVDAYVVTARDAVWGIKDSFVWRNKPLFAAATVRVLSATHAKPADAGKAAQEFAAAKIAYPSAAEACPEPGT